MAEPERVQRAKLVELAAAVLLSIATLLTAWSAHQATRWSGEQAESYTTASALRTESVRSANIARSSPVSRALDSRPPQMILLTLAVVMLVSGTVVVVLLPQNVGI